MARLTDEIPFSLRLDVEAQSIAAEAIDDFSKTPRG